MISKSTLKNVSKLPNPLRPTAKAKPRPNNSKSSTGRAARSVKGVRKGVAKRAVKQLKVSTVKPVVKKHNKVRPLQVHNKSYVLVTVKAPYKPTRYSKNNPRRGFANKGRYRTKVIAIPKDSSQLVFNPPVVVADKIGAISQPVTIATAAKKFSNKFVLLNHFYGFNRSLNTPVSPYLDRFSTLRYLFGASSGSYFSGG